MGGLSPKETTWDGRLDNVLDCAGEGIAVTDLDGKLLYQNRHWRFMHGVPPEENGRTLGTCFEPEALREVVLPMLEEAGRIGVSRGEAVHRHSSGRLFRSRFTASQLTGGIGFPNGYVIVASEIPSD